jgi:hypothetical protein
MSAEPTPQAAEAEHTPDRCPVAWCPVCMTLSVFRPVRPEVVGHLLRAGTEMFLAMQAAIDGRGAELDDAQQTGPVRLEKIDIG